jgi:hypothetical protein
MSGQKGRSGRKRLPLAHHVLSGTYRADRHGPLPANVAVMPAAPDTWQPSSGEYRQLGAEGRRLLDGMLAAYTFSLAEGLLALAAARAADAEREWRDRSLIDGQQQARASRLALAWSRHLAALLQQLKVQQI